MFITIYDECGKIHDKININDDIDYVNGRVYKGKKHYKSPKIEFHERVVSKIYKPLLDFESIYKMKQEKGRAWKTFETLKKKGETL